MIITLVAAIPYLSYVPYVTCVPYVTLIVVGVAYLIIIKKVGF